MLLKYSEKLGSTSKRNKIKVLVDKTIDNCLKTELFPYYRFNYPQTEEKGISKLSKLLVEKDILNDKENKNDLVILSGVNFDIQED